MQVLAPECWRGRIYLLRDDNIYNLDLIAQHGIRGCTQLVEMVDSLPVYLGVA